ncbi:MAG: hypothetical protein ACLR4Z_08210 [Butyricicoccaceae bacterium]
MDKKLLEALSRPRRAARDEAKRKGAKFYVAGEELDFVQPGVDVKRQLCGGAELGRHRGAAALVRERYLRLLSGASGAGAARGARCDRPVRQPFWKLMEPYEIDQLGGKLYKWLGLIGEKAEARTEEAAKNS